ncbi:MAG TPA: hypothetical protein VK176_01060, partial [Phycisphaerales bacterium]|nr:hypothetical protein [Phycisphaerales bacterium]
MPHHAPHRACALLAGLAALATASTLHAQTRIIYVDDDAHNPDMDGSSWELAYNDLQYALYDISSGGGIHSPGETEIRIAQGVYTPSPRFASRGEEFHFHGSPASGVALTVLGGFAGLVGAPNPDQRDPTRFITVLSGDLLHNDTLDPATWTDNSRQIAVADNVAGFLMDGLTFKGARGADHPQDQSYGGALRISGRTYFYARRTSREDDAVVRNCRFIDNVAGLAGGVLRCLSSENSAGIRVESCDFISNRVLSPGEWTGGGAIAAYGGVVVIEDCRFLNNAAPNRGGAVYGGVAASLLIRDSLFISNTTGTEGGAICTLEDAGFEQSPQIIDRCTFTRNAA